MLGVNLPTGSARGPDVTVAYMKAAAQMLKR
jgi:hypothetical protein